ncbi:MAG TPA: trimethylamine methyltransferase [Candidatus Aminicenantes bacterium]|nr:trimethylamine methyltransferase [Candidatus Aminicenantes bacterium]
MEAKQRLRIPRLHFLTPEKMEMIHGATLTVLKETGILVKDLKALEILKEAGCHAEGERVRIPASLVENALKNAVPRILMTDRSGRPAMTLEGDEVWFGTGSDTPHVIDPYTGQRRRTVLKDIENVSKLVDALPELSFVMCSGIASDVNPEIADIHHFLAMVSRTEKPVVFTSWNLANLTTIIEMAAAAAGGEDRLRANPFLALYTEPISPLILGRDSTQKLLFMAERSLPVVFAPGMITGATGPVTLAGGIVQANAEILAGYILANLVRPGTPFIYGGSGEPMDMSAMLMSYAAPESMLVVSALTDMSKYYGLPSFGYAGCSDSNLYDQQASLESALWILMASLNGANLVHDVGYINNGLTTSLEQIVVSAEVVGLVRRIAGGIDVDEETMALDLIAEVGPGGEYLTSEHTLRHFRDNWFPRLISRDPYEKWEQKGRKDLGNRANEFVHRILENHKPRAQEGRVADELRRIVQARDR